VNAVEVYKWRRDTGWYQSAIPLADAAIAELEADREAAFERIEAKDARIAALEQIVMGLIATHEEMWETVTEDSCPHRCVAEWDALVVEAEGATP